MRQLLWHLWCDNCFNNFLQPDKLSEKNCLEVHILENFGFFFFFTLSVFCLGFVNHCFCCCVFISCKEIHFLYIYLLNLMIVVLASWQNYSPKIKILALFKEFELTQQKSVSLIIILPLKLLKLRGFLSQILRPSWRWKLIFKWTKELHFLKPTRLFKVEAHIPLIFYNFGIFCAKRKYFFLFP